jgi:SAM-dependent methyltransferase
MGRKIEIATEKLGIITTGEKNRPDSIPVSNISRKFDALLVKWWDRVGLCGDGLIVGDGGHGQKVKSTLRTIHPEINTVQVVDLHDADILWDICTTIPREMNRCYDWVICQAVLEHVYAPFLAVQNMSLCLKAGGRLFLHTVGPAMKEHRHPTDCVRFFRDFFVEIENKLPVKIVDLLVTRYHINAFYERTL